METLLVKVTCDAQEELTAAGERIKQGGLVAFPTETVYGLGGDALQAASSRRIYEAKGRPSDNPLIVHIAEFGALHAIVREIPQSAILLAEKFWPGPLTMIFHKSELVPLETTGGLDTVAVRMPNHDIALSFIRAAGGYIAAPSANASGRPSPTCAAHVWEDLQGRIDMILDGGDVGIGVESTIVDLTDDVPMILRPGFITADMIREVLGRVEIDRTILDVNCKDRPKAPGMRYRHYAPKGELTIVEGEPDAVNATMLSLLTEAAAQGKKTGVITTTEYVDKFAADSVKCAGDRGDEAAAAAALYRMLREFDEEDIEVIYSIAFSEDGLGQAVMNRLLKAAGHQIIQV